jgi:lambda family phage minor tail protein L
MLGLSTIAKMEKNKISSDGAWLVLLEVTLPTQGDDLENTEATASDATEKVTASHDLVMRIVRNNEDIVWNGHTWVGFPFDLDEVTENSDGELPQLTLKVSNVSRVVQQYLEQTNGGVGATVKLYAVYSQYLDQPAEIEETFSVYAVKCDAYWVHFTLSGDYPTKRRIPEYRYLKDCCPFVYGGVECGVDKSALLATKTSADQDEYAKCSKTLRACKKRNNERRFGGEPAIPLGGTYISNE